MYIQYLCSYSYYRHNNKRGSGAVSTAGIATSSIDFIRGSTKRLCWWPTVRAGRDVQRSGGDFWNNGLTYNERYCVVPYWMNWYWYWYWGNGVLAEIVSIETSFDVVVNTCWPVPKSAINWQTYKFSNASSRTSLGPECCWTSFSRPWV